MNLNHPKEEERKILLCNITQYNFWRLMADCGEVNLYKQALFWFLKKNSSEIKKRIKTLPPVFQILIRLCYNRFFEVLE